MNDYKIPIIEPTIDYTKVPPINQKRTISFINHFIVHTVTFLNKFALSCEERLMEFEYKLQRIEASLEILESWLASVPGLDQDQNTKCAIENTDENKQKENDTSKDEPETVKQEEPKVVQTEEQSAKTDPRYEKYLKMVHFGVPKEAVKLKMKQEGLDPSILDTDSSQVVSKPKSTDNGENKDD
ncbi:unnamed protein product [Xylocopa violacea]|uniref:WASH complex subunit 3 n=1 Tax=Xylocopa violacea TaxID=135666 RepID=A0ABP1N3B5_XYLVO